ncbi:MAG TPA: hypothetical protein VFW07_27035 [Parafilimonas sp.]|nr:hypothetical protein [Parafilimonas sp.]
MKYPVILFSISLLIISCAQHANPNQQLQSQIDSLKIQINNAYKPGLGEFMSGIQVHHEKLWFAGTAENWQLADFEIHEIMEAVDDIKTYAADRPETKKIIMLEPAIDSLNSSIQQRNTYSFRQNFIMLTNTCNNCHTAVNYNFNKIKIPETPPFSNQVFKIDSVK